MFTVKEFLNSLMTHILNCIIHSEQIGQHSKRQAGIKRLFLSNDKMPMLIVTLRALSPDSGGYAISRLSGVGSYLCVHRIFYNMRMGISFNQYPDGYVECRVYVCSQYCQL